MSAIETLTRVLKTTPGVRPAVLFGSAARRADRPDSDLDVGVWLDGDAESVSPRAVALERAIGRPVDLIALDHTPPLLRCEIAREGVVLVDVPRGAGPTSARAR